MAKGYSEKANSERSEGAKLRDQRREGINLVPPIGRFSCLVCRAADNASTNAIGSSAFLIDA